MFGYTWYFGMLAAVVAAVAYGRYIYTIVFGGTTPSKASWIVWAFVGVIIALSYKFSGGGDCLPAVIVYAVGPPVVLFFIFQNSTWKLEPNEWGALAVSMIAIVLWWHYKSAVVGLYIEILADLLGAYGTARHAKKSPEEEDVPTWTLSAAGAITNLLAIDAWQLTDARSVIKWLYPIIVVGMCLTILAFSLRKPKTKSFSIPA